MKKYKYIGTEEQLKENGFEIEELDEKSEISHWLKFAYKDTKQLDKYKHNVFIFIGLKENIKIKKVEVNIIQFDLIPQSKYIEDITPYIQDLIALGLVVEV